jgi:hypothetical protein
MSPGREGYSKWLLVDEHGITRRADAQIIGPLWLLHGINSPEK